MRAARAIIVWLLLPLAVVGALTMSANATIDLATSQGVSEGIAPFAVLMLEVASLAGTLLWVLVGRRTLRRDAVAVTMAATGVALVAGVHAFGLFGAVASLALVGTVHLASRAWRESWTDTPTTDTGDETLEAGAQPRTVQELVNRDLSDGVVMPDDDRVVAQEKPTQTPKSTTMPRLRVVSTSKAATTAVKASRECVAMTGPSPVWPDPPANWEYGPDTWAAACEDHYRGAGRPAIQTKYGLAKPNHARQVTDAVRPFKQQTTTKAARA